MPNPTQLIDLSLSAILHLVERHILLSSTAHVVGLMHIDSDDDVYILEAIERVLRVASIGDDTPRAA